MARNRQDLAAARDIFSQKQQTNIKAAVQEANYLGKSRVAAALRAWKAQKEQSLFGGDSIGSTKAGKTLRLFGARGAAEFVDTMFGKKKPQSIIRQEEQARNERERQKATEFTNGLVQGINQINGTLNAVKMELGVVRASVIDVRRSMGDIGQDVTDIKSLIMPKTITAKGKPLTDEWGRQDKSSVGKIQFAQYNPLAPAGAQFLQQGIKKLGGGFFTRGGLTSKPIEPGFVQDAIKQAAMQTAVLTVKIQKRDAAKAELAKKNMYSDPAERKAFETDPILALRDEMMENFRKLFDMLKGLDGGGGFGVGDLPVPVPLPRGGGAGGRGRGPKGRGGTRKTGAMERYRRRYGARATRNRFGRGRGGSIFGVGALIGGYLGYKAVDSFREMTDEEHINPALMQENVEYAVKQGDVDALRKNREQIAKQQKDVKLQATGHAGAIGGAVAGNAATRLVWKFFVNFVKRRAPALAARLGARLAAAGVMATIPVFGWIGTLMTLGFSAWMAWDLYQLWKEFSALSDAEKAAFSDEAVKLDEAKDKPGAKAPEMPADALVPPPPSTGPTTRGGRRGRNASPNLIGELRRTEPAKPGTPEYERKLAALGSVIAKGESRGDYNIFNKGTIGTNKGKIGREDLSKMTIAEYLRRGSLGPNDPDKMFAVGKYQIIPTTMRRLIDKLNINPNTTTLSPSTQDRLFRELIESKPAVKDYLTGRSNNLNAAVSALSKEWASIGVPETTMRSGVKIEAGQSYYSGVGGNKAHTSLNDITAALQPAQPDAGTLYASTTPARTHRGDAIDNESRRVAQASSPAATVAALQPVIMNNTKVVSQPAPALAMTTLSGMSDDNTILNMADANHALA